MTHLLQLSGDKLCVLGNMLTCAVRLCMVA